MTTRDRIARLLRQANALTAGEIAQGIEATLRETQATLIEMDDAGDVLMRNGFYRASETLRQKRADNGMVSGIRSQRQK